VGVPILELRGVSKRFGAIVAARDLSLSVERGAFFTFLGPSGSGKSTILRMVAGLERPDAGAILIDGRDMSGVPPWHRHLGMMFQSYALFPHMTVAENVAYGLRVRGIGRRDIRPRVERMLHLVGLVGMAEKNATLLSGGEQQRVALARALAPEPRMLLLDEPLSALDEKIRRAMQLELKHVQRETGTTFLYVTHDQEEALTMSDRIAVFDRGDCVQCDEPERVYKRPRNCFVATFFRGCNVLEAELLERTGAELLLRLAGSELAIPAEGAPPLQAPGKVHVAVRAENLHFEPSSFPGLLRLSARVTEITYRGAVLDYSLLLADGQVATAMTTRRAAVSPGETVTLLVAPGDLLLLED
jgi:ABC-type Fe3+/spermidine/putrescine transport system ATPase subunit